MVTTLQADSGIDRSRSFCTTQGYRHASTLSFLVVTLESYVNDSRRSEVTFRQSESEHTQGHCSQG